MKRSRFTEEQIIGILRQAEAGIRVVDLCRRIKYRRVGDECFYEQELSEKEEFTGHLKNTMESEKSVYDRIVYDSDGVEKGFAQDFEE